jgi:RecA/RadA recombinase
MAKEEMSLVDRVRKRVNEESGKELIKTFGKDEDLLQVKSWIPLKPFFKLATGGEGFPCGHVTTIIGKPDSGKCHTKGTRVIMYDGTLKNVEDVVVGDKIMGPDSKPRNVLGLGRGNEEMFEIAPNSGGKTFGCNKSHILSLVMSGHNLSISKGTICNVSIAEFLSLNKTLQTHLKLYRSPLSFLEQSVSYDPYWVGLWLGDGSCGETHITKNEPDLEPYFEEFAKKNDLIFTKRDYDLERNGAYRYTFTTQIGTGGQPTNPLLNFVRDRLVRDGIKRIPQEYMSNSRENRLKLLAGLMDTDGYLHKDSKTGFEIMFKHKELCDDVALLARGLGFRVSSTTKDVLAFDWTEPRTYFRLSITGNCSEIPTLISRKKAVDSKNNRNPLRTGFTVKSLGFGDFYGFQLDGDHLYLLEDTTVTHNTTLAMEGMIACQKLGGIAYLIDSEHKFSMGRFALMGGNPKDVMVIQTDTLEDAWTAYATILKEVEKLRDEGITAPMILVWDSVAASVPESIMESEAGDFHVAVEAKINNKNIRKLKQLIEKTELACVHINHYYMTQPKNKYEQSVLIVKGGEELSFLSTLILLTKQGAKITRTVLGEEQQIGRTTKFTVHKGHFHGRTIVKDVSVVDIGILESPEDLEKYKKSLRGEI